MGQPYLKSSVHVGKARTGREQNSSMRRYAPRRLIAVAALLLTSFASAGATVREIDPNAVDQPHQNPLCPGSSTARCSSPSSTTPQARRTSPAFDAPGEDLASTEHQLASGAPLLASVEPPVVETPDGRDSALVAPTSGLRQSEEDVWWTGPVSITTAETLPAGRFFTQPYLFTTFSQGGGRVGSIIYLSYGLLDDLTVGLMPSLWSARRSGRKQVVHGDVVLLSQFRLSRRRPGKLLPTTAIVLQHNLPIGRYDRLALDDEGVGSGTATTSIGANVEQIFGLPNGRLLRGRLNVLATLPKTAKLRGRSVYDSPDGFNGKVKRGATLSLGGSIEYSLSKTVELALDVVHERAAESRLRGFAPTASEPIDLRLARARSVTVTAAVGYSWSGREGVLLGVRYSPKGRNSSESVTPVVSLTRFW